MKTVGVTGGIGSGKTTFCKVWEKLGAAVYYADDSAKRLMVQDEVLIRKLKEAFGEDTYHEDGSLNKSHLIREAFEKGRVDTLNKLVHPAVAKNFKEFVKNAESESKRIVVKEAALLLMGGRPKDLDLIVLILSDKDKRIGRVVERDDVSEKEVENRDSKQPKFDQLTQIADYVVVNDGTLKELEQKAKNLYVNILG
tara:strand:- start:97347 stop:97937 length:591 start_codon:yes stop_codon:yes gene_type:complete